MKNDSLSQETKKKKFNTGGDEKSGVKRNERRKKWNGEMIFPENGVISARFFH